MPWAMAWNKRPSNKRSNGSGKQDFGKKTGEYGVA
jgi:hypothetical protein